ncbi:MAG: nitrilase-related carbon-nitrogen hydrolase, partial [Dethiobacteria bacterium]
MSRIVRVALIQAKHEVHGDEPVARHQEKAIEKHLKLIKEAADKKAQIVCLQEIFNG